MARPNSKYFAPVIKKLLEVKKSERIDIDQEFKSALRMKVLVAAAQMKGAPVRQNVEKAASFSARPGLTLQSFDIDKFVDWFNKWKYQLALAPTALVILLVAAYAFKSPISIKNDTLVPAVSNTNVNNSTVQTDASESAPMLAMVASNSVPEDVSQIKLFPGRTVLPAGYLNRNNVSTSDALTENSVQPEIYSAKNNVENVSNVQKQVPENIQAPVIPALMNQYALTMSPVPSVSRPPIERKVVETDAVSIGSGTSSGVTVASGAEATQQKTTMISQVVPDSTTQEVSAAVSFAVPTQQVAEASAPINMVYAFDTKEAERVDFETSVLPRLLTGDSISSIIVTLGTEGVWGVEIHYVNGKIETANFKKNAATNFWNRVKFVKRGYYDDSLIYEVVGL